MTPRRHTDTDDDGALSRKVRPFWSLLTLIASVLTAAGVGLAATRAVAAFEADQALAPLARRVDGHLSEMLATRALMERYVEEERSARCSIARNVHLLCQQARAKCEPVSANCNGGP